MRGRDVNSLRGSVELALINLKFLVEKGTTESDFVQATRPDIKRYLEKHVIPPLERALAKASRRLKA